MGFGLVIVEIAFIFSKGLHHRLGISDFRRGLCRQGKAELIEQSPDFRAAFKKSIEYKLDKHWKNNQVGFMSFGLVQLGQSATSLGDGELAYHCLKHLVKRFWLNNLASMHNHRSLFNMDISGGMPAVIIKMLVASDPGKIRLLPALPSAWPSGEIAGPLCRGGIIIHSLKWDKDTSGSRSHPPRHRQSC